MSNFAFVLNSNKQPLNPIHPGAARRLLKAGKAAVYLLYPFTIIYQQEVSQTPNPIELKLDPGSKTTGIALLLLGSFAWTGNPSAKTPQNDKVIWAAELTHRGQNIQADLESRRVIRRNRRARKTRYRQARFLNRTGVEGWLAPSLQHRVDTTLTWVNKLIKFAPIVSIVQELVRFDLQQLEKPEISGIEYQQGELLGYEVREYLLSKWDRKCTYCEVKDVPLQVEHVVPKAKGGSNRISNLCLACDRRKYGVYSSYACTTRYSKSI